MNAQRKLTMSEHTIQEAAMLIEKSTSFLMTCHLNPDADALGSVLALGLALKSIGHDVDFYNYDGVPDSLLFLPRAHLFSTTLNVQKHYDIVIVGDCGDRERLGRDFEHFKNYDHLINVDHHFSNTRYGDVNIIDDKAPSTGAIMAYLIRHLEIPWNSDMATSVYITLVTDTGSFQYRNTTVEAFQLAADMVSLGVDPGKVSQSLYFSFPIEKLILLQRVLATLEMSKNGDYASIVLYKKDLDELKVPRDIAEDFVEEEEYFIVWLCYKTESN